MGFLSLKISVEHTLFSFFLFSFFFFLPPNKRTEFLPFEACTISAESAEKFWMLWAVLQPSLVKQSKKFWKSLHSFFASLKIVTYLRKTNRRNFIFLWKPVWQQTHCKTLAKGEISSSLAIKRQLIEKYYLSVISIQQLTVNFPCSFEIFRFF